MKKLVKIVFGKTLVFGISILIQIIWAFSLFYKLNRYYVPVTSIVKILAVIIVMGIIVNRDNPAYKLVWAVVILGFPVLGVFLYLFIGQSKIPKKQNAHFQSINKRFDIYREKDDRLLERVENDDYWVKGNLTYLQNYSGYDAYENTDIVYYNETDKAYKDLLAELENASKYIFMEYFAIENGESFGRIVEILARKVKEGVKVRIIFDDFGSLAYVNGEFIKKIQAQGIEIKAFNPLIPVFYIFMNNRDHRKITVIDGKVSFNGGFNLCDEYFNINCPFGHWKDTAIKLQGDAVKNHIIMFLQMWNSINDTDKNYDFFLNIPKYEAKDKDAIVLPFSDSPLDNECVGENVYLNIIRNAKKYVYIFTPYLIIDNEMMEVLCLTAKCGVDVRIVTPGIPDKKAVYQLTKSYYPQLLDAGVRIYHYTPGFIHAKCYISDDIVGVVGTINMDYRSLYMHFECATFMYKSEALKEIKADFLDTFEKSEEVNKKVMSKSKSIFYLAYKSILRLFAPLM